MKPRSPLRRLLCTGPLGLWLAGWSARAQAGSEADPAVLESLGMYVASLQRSLQRWPEVRGVSQPSEAQAGALELLLRDVTMLRLHLQTRARDLPADCRQAQVLQRFFDDWPEARLAEGVSASPRQSPLDAAVRQLARELPERRSLPPPFRLFRP